MRVLPAQRGTLGLEGRDVFRWRRAELEEHQAATVLPAAHCRPSKPCLKHGPGVGGGGGSGFGGRCWWWCCWCWCCLRADSTAFSHSSCCTPAHLAVLCFSEDRPLILPCALLLECEPFCAEGGSCSTLGRSISSGTVTAFRKSFLDLLCVHLRDIFGAQTSFY